MNTPEQSFDKGYRDSKESLSSPHASSLATSPYFDPPDGFRDAYEAGWKKAESDTTARLATQERRGNVAIPILIGLILLVAGASFTFFTIASGGSTVVIAYGAMVAGLASILKGIMTAFRPTAAEEDDE